ncbi:MAG: hypothetical protein ACPG5P_04680 [Saprospiraceae bacterium]
MMELNEAYKEHLLKIAEAIQASEQLEAFLETEEMAEYKALQEAFEPHIEELYKAVANDQPLQLVALEKELLNEDLVGLYLPKALGFSILRGQLNANYKYLRPQDHFKDIMTFVCNSPNFDILKARIGQSVQVGFSISSDIWVTNILNSVANKRVKWFLQNQKLHELRDILNRKSTYVRYKRQFKDYNFLSAEFPETQSDLVTLFGLLRDFLIYRTSNKLDNVSLYHPFTSMLMKEELKGCAEYTYILGMFLNFFELNEEYAEVLGGILNEQRKNNPDFSDQYMAFLLDLHSRKKPAIDAEADKRILSLLNEEFEDPILHLYQTLKTVHEKGYVNLEVMQEVRKYHEQYDGLSDNNEAVRQSILVYIRKLVENLEVSDYATWFEMHKIFKQYMSVFGNEQFNQSIKELYRAYLRRLLRRYTDKRGGDYQGVKKFTIATFIDCKFMKEKDVRELFKTKRKKKPVADK